MMAHFYGGVTGMRGEATRLGSKASGLSTFAASWEGAVRVHLYERDGVDYADVSLVPHHGGGMYKALYSGPVSGNMATLTSERSA